ncbi:MAG: hypothetical protein M1812_002693 [Candelaria pacifica]|nr:MAG: hypothetical protein M1812_002693 [Candelaria pacifica]
MGLRRSSLLALCLLSSITHQVSIGLQYEYYSWRPNPVCHDIEPGVCCRTLYNSRPYTIQQVSLLGAWFHGLESLDIASTWSSQRRAWGCSGTVLDTATGADYNYFQVPESRQTLSPMTGASYLRLSQRSASMAAAEGIKAFVAGGAKAACSIIGIEFNGHSKRDGEISAGSLTAPVRWMWPNLITLGGSNYTEFGGAGSLRYRNDEGKELDFPELRAKSASAESSEIDSEATYCKDDDTCGGEGSNCGCKPVALNEPNKLIMFGGRKALGGFCLPRS